MALWICWTTAALAGPFDARVPNGAGEATVRATGSLESFSAATSANRAAEPLPASWGVAQLSLWGQVGLHPHLSAEAHLSWWDATAAMQQATACEELGVCEAVRAPGDLGASLSSPWHMGPWRATGRITLWSGVAYRAHLESFGAPGNGNLDLRVAALAGRSGTLGPLSWHLDAGLEAQRSFGRPPNALRAGAQGALATDRAELELAYEIHQSIGGADLDPALADPTDPGRLTDLDHDLQRLQPSLRVALGPETAGLWLESAVWLHFDVDNGPSDRRGASLGLLWRP